MSGIKEQAELEAMRKRLYERAAPNRPVDRVVLKAPEPEASRTWQNVPPPPQAPITEPRDGMPATTPIVHARNKKRRTYRTIILLGTVAVFLLVLGVTGLYMFLGNNQISNKNINISIMGPITAGGGEEMGIELTIENNNKVAIESAVLIVNFPPGTRSVEDKPRDMLEERVTIGRIAAGEVLRVPQKAVVFGEENQERTIKATIEYRLVGSSGTFYKESEPLNFKIISSPVVIKVKALEKVSSGQEVPIELVIQSNAPTPLKDILVTADYPSSFDFSSANPSPAYRENTWLIPELLPERTETITLKGVIVGQQAEEFQLKFAAGTAKPDNQFEVGSLLANAVHDFSVEQPFISVDLSVEGIESEIVTLKTGGQVNVSIKVRNTLADTLYDMAVEVGIAGNILLRDRVNVQNGFYDSVKDVIRFEPSGDPSLSSVSPGQQKQFTFMLQPNDTTATPAFTVTANAFARRVSENNATEQLVGTAKTEVKFTSSVAVARELGRGNTGFSETGPVPPVADVSTTYTVTLIATAGGNDVTGGTLTTALPQYVNWQNQTKGDGNITFNPVSKEVLWNVGDISARGQKQISFQVSLLPSQNQIGESPAIVSTQYFRATDRFTGEVIRAEGYPLSTELSTEAGFPKDNGKVQAAP